MVTVIRNLSQLSRAPSESERAKAARTHNEIRAHLESDPALGKYQVDTFLQGSYKNSTNVVADSDIDLGSLTESFFHFDLQNLPSKPLFGATTSLRAIAERAISPTTLTFADYRRAVLGSLCRKYGTSSVIDGNKAIMVKGNAVRLDADVLPCTAFRQYYNQSGRPAYHSGIAFFTKQHVRVVNFPHQHFENLASKDQANNGKVKGCIRILKRVRNELEERKQWDRKRSPSFYIESLVWNVPDRYFIGGYESVLQNVLAHLWDDLRQRQIDNTLDVYLQANRIFYLFNPRFWNVEDAIDFIDVVCRQVFRS